jgi:hypothetical protein
LNFFFSFTFRFGQVYKGKYRGAQVAIKQVKSTKDVSSKQIEEFLDELELMVYVSKIRIFLPFSFSKI